MVDLDTREWLLTNGLGSFASGTVSDVRTRTYHGWLFAATKPPLGRSLLLSHLEASLELSKQVVALGTNFWGSGQIDPTGYELLRCFDIHPVPKWVWGEDDWQLSRQLLMPYGVDKKPQTGGTPVLCDRILIQYRYDGSDRAVLKLRLLISDRNLHNQQKAVPELQFSQLLGHQEVCLQAIHSGQFGTPWHLRWTQGTYQPDAFWYWNYHLPEETRRGLSDREDLYSPGYLVVVLQPGDTVTLEARVGFPNRLPTPLTDDTFAEAIEAEQERLFQIFGSKDGGCRNFTDGGWGGLEGWIDSNKNPEFKRRNYPETINVPLSLFPGVSTPANVSNFYCSVWQQLLQATDQFVVYRTSIAAASVIAGYHWFNDWGRDTLIALPGLALVTQRFDLAKELLQSLGRYCRHGLIPNAFPNGESEPFYNSIDVALWWIETLGLYLEATQDWEFLVEQYPVFQQIYKAFIGGTRYNIQVDSIDGLVGWDARGVALTWMDALVDGEPVTPRRGKPVEINALWYSALCWASRWAEILSEQDTVAEPSRLLKQAQRYNQHAQQVKTSLQKFWNSQLGYLYDTIEPDDRRNSQVRPNAVIALSLAHCAFSEQQGRQILQWAIYRLLTPYGLRTLDPTDPEYIGKYAGSSQQRDRSYHQGTVWSWLIGPFIRAWRRFYPIDPLPFDWQPLLEHFLCDGCLGSISEIFDGDEPHTPRGAIAQAKSVAEVIRHYME